MQTNATDRPDGSDDRPGCPACGAKNPATTGFCWQCFAPLGQAARLPSAPSSATTGTFRQPQQAAQPSVPAKGTYSKIRPWVRVVAVIIAIAAIAGYVQHAKQAAYEFPAQLLGSTKSAGDLPASKAAEAVARCQVANPRLVCKGAFYEADGTPKFMVMTISGHTLNTTDDLWFVIMGGTDNFTMSGTSNDAEYRCGLSGQVTGCIWRKGDVAGGVVFIDGTPLSGALDRMNELRTEAKL